MSRKPDANIMVLNFFFPGRNECEMPTNSLHILDMYRTIILGLFPSSDAKEKNTTILGLFPSFYPEWRRYDLIRSAVELHKVRIKFKRSKTAGLRDISFKNGELWLSWIVIDYTTERLFLNLIAYEKFHAGTDKGVNAFVFFMSSLIHDSEDIKVLSRMALVVIKRLPNWDITSPLAGTYGSVNAYRYLTKTRVIISGGILITVLTIIQTIYSILQFYQK